MAAKSFVVYCVCALLVQTISGQCIGSVNSIAGTALTAEELALAGNALAYGSNLGGRGYTGCQNNYGLTANSFVPSSGGAFAVTSASPIAPTGITVISENAIEGALAVNGELPFLSAVFVEGALPTAGAGGINYGCGNGAVGIVSESIAPVSPLAPAAGIAPGRLGAGFAGLGAPALGFGAAGLGLGAPGLGLGAPGLGLGAPGLGFNGVPTAGCGYNGIF